MNKFDEMDFSLATLLQNMLEELLKEFIDSLGEHGKDIERRIECQTKNVVY